MDNQTIQYNLKKIQSNVKNKNIFLDSYPFQIHFLMNDKCNASCIMCGGDYARSTSGRRITLDKFKTMSANLRLEYCRSVVLAGAGDPMLNSDLIPIIQFIRQTYPDMNIAVTTNGIALSEKMSKRLIENDVNSVNISINAATRPTYKRIMQIDLFDQVCRNARKFAQLRNRAGKPATFQFSAAINRLNIEELPELVRISREIGISSINLFYTRFYPEHIRDANIIDPADRLENSHSLFYHQALSDRMVTQAKELAQQYNIGFCHESLFKENALRCHCTWAYSQLMVGFDGEIYPCGGSEVHFREKVEKGIYNFGNALKESIDGFWNKESYRDLRLSSQQGDRCLVSECRCCANTMGPNDERCHIMDWEHSDRPFEQPQASATAVQKQLANPEPARIPLVSVIVPTYNRPDQLAAAIKSIHEQTYSHVEIIVVNDFGLDVGHRLWSFEGQRPLTYVKHGVNKGLAAARNTGLKLAQGKYVAYLDDDDLFHPDHLETLVNYLESNNVQIAYTDAYRAHQTVRNGEYVVTKRDVPYSFDFDYDRILETNFIPVLCFMHERACIDRVGFFDESLKRLEDWDMWIRLSRQFTFGHIKKTTCEFAWRSDGTTMSSGQKQAFVRAREIIEQKHKLHGLDTGAATPQKQKPIRKGMVSIVILTCNQIEYTRKCVASIQKHTPETHEIVFVDNHSTDGTLKWLKKQIAQNKHYHLVANDDNLGFAKGCNQGMEVARGEYILLLNNDVVVTPGWLSGLVECLQQEDGLGIVGPMTNSIGGPQQVDEVGYDALADLNAYAKAFRDKNRHRRIPLRRMIGYCMLFHHTLFKKIGGFDGRFGYGTYEDDDFSLRSALIGMKNLIAGDVFIHHFGSRTFIGNGIECGAAFRKNRGIFKEKWGAVDPQSTMGKRLFCITHTEKALEHAGREEFDEAVETLLNVIEVSPEDRKPYYALAQTLIHAQKPDAALDLLNSVETEADDIDKIVLSGYCRLELGQLDSAGQNADEALAYHPKSATALTLKGIIEYQSERSEAAAELFKAAITDNPSCGAPYSKLGVLTWENGECDEALSLFEKGFILSPTVPDIASDYHAAVNAAGAFSRAETIFREAKSLHPQNKIITFYYIDILLQQKKYHEAMTMTEQAMIRFGMNDDILSAALSIRQVIGPITPNKGKLNSRSISLCTITRNAGEKFTEVLSKSKTAADEIIVVDTGSTDRTADIAKAFGAQVYSCTDAQGPGQVKNLALSKARGDFVLWLDQNEVLFEADCLHLKKSMAQSSKKTALSFTIREYAISVGDMARLNVAKKSFVENRELRLFPNDNRIRCQNSDDERTEPVVAKLGIAVKDSDVSIHRFKGNTVSQNTMRVPIQVAHSQSSGKHQDTISQEDRMIEKMFQQACVCYEKEDYASAMNLLNKVLDKCPAHLEAFKQLINTILLGTHPDDLQALMASIASGKELSPEMVAVLGAGLEAAGDLKNAERLGIKALEFNPEDAVAVNLTGVLAYREGDLAKADTCFKKAAALDPLWGDPMTNLGTVHWDTGNQEAALDALEKGFLLSPTAPNVAVAYHAAIAATGAYKRSESIFKQVNERFSNFRKGRNLLIDTLLKQNKIEAAMNAIEALLLDFSCDEETLQVAKQVRGMIGPQQIDTGDKPSVSVCMIVKNEAEYLAKCLSSVRPVVDEIIVVDTGSMDNTRDIATVFGAKVFNFDWADDFSAARNFSIAQASGDWVLILDGDEVLSVKDYRQFQQLVQQTQGPHPAYSIVTRNYTHQCNTIGWMANAGEYGREEAGTGWTPSEKVRLFRREPDIRFQYPVHEVVGPALKRKGVRVERSRIPIHHYGRLNLEQLHKKGKKYLQIGMTKLSEMEDDEVALQELAVEAGLQGENQTAIDLWHKLLRLKGDTAKAHINLSTLHGRQSDFAKAAQHARKARSLAPDMKEARFNLALANLHLNRVDTALADFEKLVKKASNYYPAMLMTAACHSILGNMDEAGRYIDQLKESPYGRTLQYPIEELIQSLKKANQHEAARKLEEWIVCLGLGKVSADVNEEPVSDQEAESCAAVA